MRLVNTRTLHQAALSSVGLTVQLHQLSPCLCFLLSGSLRLSMSSSQSYYWCFFDDLLLSRTYMWIFFIHVVELWRSEALMFCFVFLTRIFVYHSSNITFKILFFSAELLFIMSKLGFFCFFNQNYQTVLFFPPVMFF